MPEIYKSPGVYITEQDLSYYSRGTEEASTALITPTVKGAKFIPAKVYSFTEYEQLFGSTFISGSQEVEYFGSISARDFFSNGGTSLLVVPIGSGSFSPASSSVFNSLPTASVAFTLETLSDGTILNSGPTEVSGSNGILTNGSIENFRWEIRDVNTAKGTFSLIIRQGDDNSKVKTVIEEFKNLSLDPTSENFIKSRIGDVDYQYNPGSGYIDKSGSYDNRSIYVRVASVVTPTPYYLDTNGVAKPQFTGSLPSLSSGSFVGASDGKITHPQAFYGSIDSTNSQGFTANTNAYSIALDILSNKEEYQYDILLTPGVTALTHPNVISKIQSVVESRNDCLAIVDMVPYGYNPTDAVAQAENYDSSDMATYYCNWIEVRSGGKKVMVPESTVIGGVMAFSKAKSEAWFAPAGLTRGGLPGVTNVGRKLLKVDREMLYEIGVNPIEKTIADGINVMGQRTLQKRSTALDRISVKLFLIDAQRFVTSAARKILFEPDTEITRQKFLTTVIPYFERVQERQGLYSFRVIMDSTINTNETIDRNMLVGLIQLQPTKTVEVIEIPFEIYPTGVEFRNP